MPGPSIVDTYGAALIGQLVSTMLFGLTVAQTWIYFWNYWNTDPKALKFFIAFVSFMDALHTALCSYTIYWYLILNFGNVENLDYTMWAMNIQGMISAFVSAPVQFYYARRVYIVSKDIICPIVIVALTVVSSSLQFVFGAKVIVLKRFSLFHTIAWIPITGLSATAVTDVLIAAALCWSLYRRRTGFARTDSIIMSLMAYSINSGFLLSVLAVAMTIAVVISPSSMIPVAIYWTMSKCYVNSLLAMLNSRDYIRDQSSMDSPENAINLSSIRVESSSDAYRSKSGQPGISVTVHRSTRLGFERSKSDHVVEPTFDDPKAGASITAFQTSES